MITPFSEPVISELARAGLDVDDVERIVSTAVAEDMRYGPDVTTQACVSPDSVAEAVIRARRAGVLAGMPVALAVLDAVLAGSCYELHEVRVDGEKLAAGDVAVRLSAPVRRLLAAERPALNLLCHLSGIATATALWVDAVAGTRCRIRDSRKTLPGLRMLQKYAVRCGGGINHRFGLGDAVLIKDNHVVVAGTVTAAIAAVRAHAPGLPLEVEVDTLEQLDEALGCGTALVMLDNMTVAQCREAVRRADVAGGTTQLEASGGLTLDTAGAYADTGVHYLAVGSLTHSAAALDLGLDLEHIQVSRRDCGRTWPRRRSDAGGPTVLGRAPASPGVE